MPGAGTSVTKGDEPSAVGEDFEEISADTSAGTPAAQRALKVVSGSVLSRTEATVPSSASGSINLSLTKRKQERQNPSTPTTDCGAISKSFGHETMAGRSALVPRVPCPFQREADCPRPSQPRRLKAARRAT